MALETQNAPEKTVEQKVTLATKPATAVLLDAAATFFLENADSWTRLQESKTWAALTLPQQKWISLVLSGTSGLTATGAAYHPATKECASVMTSQMKRKPKIQEAVAIFRGRPPADTEREQLIERVEENIRAADLGSNAMAKFLALRKTLLREIRNARPVEADEPEESKPAVKKDEVVAVLPKPAVNPNLRFRVGEICIVDGKAYRATEIDANGQVTKAEQVK